MRRLEAWMGNISECCRQLCEAANKHNEPVCYEFNGIEVVADPGDDHVELEARWRKEVKRQYQRHINSDDYKRQQRAREKAQEARSLQLKDALEAAPPMEFKDKEGWDKWREKNP